MQCCCSRSKMLALGLVVLLLVGSLATIVQGRLVRSRRDITGVARFSELNECMTDAQCALQIFHRDASYLMDPIPMCNCKQGTHCQFDFENLSAETRHYRCRADTTEMP